MKKYFVVTLILQLAVLSCHAQPRVPDNAPVGGLSNVVESEPDLTEQIAVGKEPNSVEIADLNGDGKLDLVVANRADNNVTILLGNGKGKFAQAKGSPFPAGNTPNDICFGDFNGDRKPDLAIANTDEKYLTILLGDGKGGFISAPGSPVTVLSRPHTHGVAAGDFNKDGKLDLVTDSWGDNKVTVVFGDGLGGFAGPGTQFAVGKRPYQRVRVADVNLDGNADIITTNSEGDNVTVLLGDGKGGFNEAVGSPFPSGKTPFALAIGDLNGDGKPDLAIANWAGQPEKGKGEGATIMLGDGRGGFKTLAGSPFPTGDGPNRIAIGDIDGDGVPDVAVSNYTSNNVTVLRGAKITFTRTTTIPIGRHPEGIALGDLNGDGKADIVVTNTDDNSISILFSK
jgi:FG-GAP-like repeat